MEIVPQTIDLSIRRTEPLRPLALYYIIKTYNITFPLQSSKPGSITQGYPVQQNNPNVQNNMYPNRHRY